MKKFLFSLLASGSLLTTNAQNVIFYDGFEDYTNFEIGNFGEWKQFDLDGGTTWAIQDGTFPNQGYVGSGIIFNNSLTTGINLPTYAGQKGLYFFASGASNTAYPNNDWSISPKISLAGITEAKLELYAKGNQLYGPDQFNIGVSSAQDPTSMTKINSAVVVPATAWTKYEFDLSAYAGQDIYIGINCTTDDGLVLMIDEFKVIEGTATPPVLPDCPTLTLPLNGATGVEYANGASFSWTAPSGDITGYDFYLDGELLGSTTLTAVNVTGLEAETTYQWSVIAKNSNGVSINCTEFSFTTGTSPVAPYCGPLAFIGLFGENVEPITLVKFAGIDNATDAELDNSPSHEIFLDKVADVKQGDSHEITIKGNTGGDFENNFAVFIDWNQDGTFDASETYITPSITNSTGLDSKESKYTIEVPTDALEGTTRMRVKKIYGTTNLSDACAAASYGQAEEYSVKVSPTLGVTDLSKSQLSVHPNPVVDILNIESASKVTSVAVFDLTGKALSNYKLEVTKSQINLSSLNSGVYILKVTTEDGKTQSVKVVKK